MADEKPYYSLDQMLRERFHEKVYKLSLDAGCSCPIGTVLWEPEAVFSAAPAAAEISPVIENSLFRSSWQLRKL